MFSIERCHQLFELDRESGVLRWRAPTSNRVRVGDAAGHRRADGYLEVRIDGHTHRVHRVIFAMVHGFVPDEVDHRDGDPRNNRPANLRAANRSQNRQNSGLPRNNTSGTKGVSWSARAAKWQAQCMANGRRHSLGYYPTIQEASAAVRAARERLHGEFARHE